jgi:FMN phosphatase YigB (HAD superfamily)
MTRRLAAVCLDFGDTLVDEATEVKDATLTTLRAELIPGAGELVRELKRRGYPLALVADGRPRTYRNVLSHYSLYRLFDVHTISEEVGVEKPDARMFRDALGRLGIGPEDYGRVVMLGNNLERDVKGANYLGVISVWLDWSPRHSKTPTDATEVPQHTIQLPLELLGVIDSLEANGGVPNAR